MKQKFNPYEEKYNIGLVIYEIGVNQKVKLCYTKDGLYMVTTNKDNWYPEIQGEINSWDYEAVIKTSDDGSGGDWAKYTAEYLIDKIVEQMVSDGIQIQQ